MIKELKFLKKVKKTDTLHICQHLERQGFEVVAIQSTHGRDLVNKLKIEDYDPEGFVYQYKNFKYVFIDTELPEDDKVMILLHECGHIELEHKTLSKLNEAKAWRFALQVQNIKKKLMAITLVSLLIISSAVLPVTIYSKIHNKKIVSASTNTVLNLTDTVYITRNGSKYHLEGCYYIRGTTTLACNKCEAEKLYSPCSICTISK